MRDTFLASQKGGESIYIKVLEKTPRQHCLPVCFSRWQGVWRKLECGLSCLGEESQSLHQEREDPGSANNVMWALEKHSFLAWRLVSYLSPGQVVVWQSIQFQKHVDRSMEIQRTEATRMLQGTDLQEQSNKTEYSLHHSGKRGYGWAEGD